MCQPNHGTLDSSRDFAPTTRRFLAFRPVVTVGRTAHARTSDCRPAPSVKGADSGIDRYGGYAARLRRCGSVFAATTPFCVVVLRTDILISTVRVGATSSCRRPSSAALTGHEANMTDTGIFNENLRKTWTTERVALLKSCVNAGLSCGQIAHEIGVSRNAVIGKINRLGLSRGRSAATATRSCAGAARRRPQVLTQRLALRALFASEPAPDDVVSTEPCSLLNLAPRKCRWPITAGDTAEFSFCGNITTDGMSYCAGHARIAYRLAPQRARVVSASR